jgi:ribitol-5-phosphate 2-dehydrogenase (NADP+) / D-ribitol-5-phosphate cytidylyltransferase
MKNYAIILASGSGKRFNSKLPKQFLDLNGKTVIEHSIEKFEENKCISDIVVVINPDFKDYFKKLISNKNYKKIIAVVIGGKTRFESSFNGINAIKENEANVLIHDAARPFITDEIISNSVKALEKYSAINLCIPITDSIIKTNDGKFIYKVCNRNDFMFVQTPQSFKLSLIKKAYNLAIKENKTDFTDDASVVSYFALEKVYILEGSKENTKITYPEDI